MKYFITGGTGSLGKSLVSELLSRGNEVIIYSRDEGKQALHFGSLKPDVECVIGDVRDYDKLLISMKRHKPEVVIHTAALKRVDDMEFYPDECIKTNIQGSENVAKASLLSGVEKCTLISTDKACQPVNVYGSSKFIAERIFTNYDYNSNDTVFSSVRYGNVIASRGSFIPLWLSLLQSNKEINVTSLDMTRFLFTIEDAVSTVLSSCSAAEGGEVFVPGIKSYNMDTIIRAISHICGAEVRYNVTGLRPGEKMHEDMLSQTELPYTYGVPKTDLLCIRPQYSRRLQRVSLSKYEGPEFNSALHASSNVEQLSSLIRRGLQEVTSMERI